jgi:ubiquinone/menaquinone biosynthesis C-methylase UbiE
MTGTQSKNGKVRFSRRVLLDEKKIRKGRTRWNQVEEALKTFGAKGPGGPLLDCGCGVGHFVLEGRRRGLDVYGIDPSASKIARYHKLLEHAGAPSGWRRCCAVGDGGNLPLHSDRFATVCSWFVLEHVPDPVRILREMMRVLRPGGLLLVRAEDARIPWEGHYKIPWMPFMAPSLAKTWVEAFGKTWKEELTVYPVTQPQVRAMLEDLGCEIRCSAALPSAAIDASRTITDEWRLRIEAHRLRRRFESGRWEPPRGDLYLIAKKRA